MYGDSFNGKPKDFKKIFGFDYEGQTIQMQLTTTKDLIVFWDSEGNDFTTIELPIGATSHTVELNKTFTEAKLRNVQIAEILKNNETELTESTALTNIDFTTALEAKNIFIWDKNVALEYLRIIGGLTFEPQDFNFAGLDGLKEIYLVQTNASTVTLDCPRLEVFATSRSIYDPGLLMNYSGIQTILSWPDIPEIRPTLSKLTIKSCPNLKKISLENTLLTTFNFSRFSNLQYIFVSSLENNMVNGMNSNLVSSLSTIPDRTGKQLGHIFVRSVANTGRPSYHPFVIYEDNYDEIYRVTRDRNWNIHYQPSYEIYPRNIIYQ